MQAAVLEQLSPPSQKPSPSESVPSLAGVLSANGPKPSTPMLQSSQPSLSLSSQTVGSVESSSSPSATPSLSSSVSSASQMPSLSVSVAVTITLKLVLAVLPLTSVVLYVTVVVPKLKESPDVWELDVDAMPQLSTGLSAGQNTAVLQAPGSAAWVMSPGTSSKEGSSSSVTEMRKLLADKFPLWSTAV